MSNTVPVPNTKLTPEGVIEQLRSMRSQIDEVEPLSSAQRRMVKQRLRTQKPPIVEASINVMGVIENVSQAIGQPLGDVRELQTEAIRWEAAADETRAFLKSLEGANLVRRQRLALIGTQAYSIGTQLAKDPANAVLVPHVEEVKKLKTQFARRKKKAAPAPQTPAPQTPAPTTTPAPAPAHDMSTTPKA